MSKTALILLNGEQPSRQTLERYWQDSGLRICADGAAAVCLEYGIQPDLIIGDLDSLEDGEKSQFPSTSIIEIIDQERTDGEKAIQYCLDEGYQNINLLGAQGKRVDHSLYNLGLLRKYDRQVEELAIISGNERIFLISGERTLSANPGTRISLLPVFGMVDNVTVHGLEYPIENETLELGGHSSISNTFIRNDITVSVASGYLLVVMEVDRFHR